ncbi:hypothetical protein FDP41_013449 [Naegleria fowleri]|uniref:Transcription factor Iwr1 domain-containing protein n=1 Tax=Naegleria fowleri TaxID=5763 RepID=A0A6A5C420_NAEFO|nr:uncharacterized protein FDP41_013449 [Naegleria fowleri]KAF0980235.1 hypothetical protein FDP41_013449 [Naegleria fowleri]
MLQTSAATSTSDNNNNTKIQQPSSSSNTTSSEQPKFQEKAHALNHVFDELDSKLRKDSNKSSTNNNTTNSFSTVKMPPGLSLEDMSFWLNYRQEIDYSKPTPFACPPIGASYQYTSSEPSEQENPKRKIKAKSSQKRKQQNNATLLNHDDDDNILSTKVFCIKRKRNEEPIETFYIPSIQQTKKTKISDLEKHLANATILGDDSSKKKEHDFSISPNVSLFKFTLLKTPDEKPQENIVKKKQEAHSASLKQTAAIDSKSKTTDRLKSHQESLKQKRLLRINEKRREGDKEIVEFGFVQEKPKKTTEELLSPYESLLKQAYGNDSLEELKKHEQEQEDDFEIDYYTVETTNEMQDEDEQPHANTVLRFESFDDQLWLENTLDDGLFNDEDEYDSEDSNASGNPNNDYPDEEEEDDEYYDEDYYGGNQYYDDGEEQYYDEDEGDDADEDYY